jgi:hypothetical protein
MFEHPTQPLLPRSRFYARLARSGAIGVAVIAPSLAVGMAGYHWLEGLGWLDSFLNASMLLGGMGPVNAPVTWGGKLFAGFYALYCGFVVLVVAGLLLAPMLHRLLHKFHLENKMSDRSD